MSTYASKLTNYVDLLAKNRIASQMRSNRLNDIVNTISKIISKYNHSSMKYVFYYNGNAKIGTPELADRVELKFSTTNNDIFITANHTNKTISVDLYYDNGLSLTRRNLKRLDLLEYRLSKLTSEVDYKSYKIRIYWGD